MLKLSIKLCFIIYTLQVNNAEESVEYYEELIKNGQSDSLKFELPTDSKMYQATDTSIEEYGSYDFVIIGGGTTGCVIANRLTEMKKLRVLVLEAGKPVKNNNFSQFPRYYMHNSFSEYNWGFKSVPQKTACLGTVDQTCFAHRGKGLGGTTLINGLIYSRGSPENYNNWAAITEDDTWRYENILPYFKKSEDFHWTNPKARVDLKYHGEGGYMNIEHHLPEYSLTDIFLATNKEFRLEETDYNSPNQNGSSIFQLNTKNGRRQDAASMFITPFMDRPNLEVLTESFVTKIEIDKSSKIATSVIFTHSGKTYKVNANKEIILSAGAISSPQILMLSGIGPKKHLKKRGIDVISDLRVGETLRDHCVNRGLIFSSNITKPGQTLEEQVEDYLKGYGILTAPTIAQALAFYPVGKKGNAIQIITDITEPSEIEKKYFGWKEETYKAMWGENKNAIGIGLILLNTSSFGTVRLKSKNPFDYPLIDFNLLSDPEGKDIEALEIAIHLANFIHSSDEFKNIGVKYNGRQVPGCKDFDKKSRTKTYWMCFLRHTTLPGQHPVGTCPMGRARSKGGVVDPKLRVFGVKKLRVADASIFPTTLTGYPSATCTMIGEKLSHEIKLQYDLKDTD